MNLIQYRHWHQQWVNDAIPTKPKPLVMGIVNVTPDSFYDGGRRHNQAIEHAHLLIKQGADILDIGGESSRPSAQPVSAEEEIDRIAPIITAIRDDSDIILSVDTHKATVMQACVELGANFINDITALPDQTTRQWLAKQNLPVCLMHMQKTPQTMQVAPDYPDGVVPTISEWLNHRISECLDDGINRDNIIIDPGFGFGKSDAHNLSLLHHINDLTQLSLPVLLGVSRKNTLGKVTGCAIEDRLAPSLAATSYALLKGVALFRTHDVAETVACVTMLDAIVNHHQTEEALDE